MIHMLRPSARILCAVVAGAMLPGSLPRAAVAQIPAARAAPGASAQIQAQPRPLGQFEDHADVGGPATPGDASFDSPQRYTVTAGGANMWNTRDEFHFVWRRVKGDFILQARLEFSGPGVEPHRKAGVIARSSIDSSASYVDGAIHGVGMAALQMRRQSSAMSEMMVAAEAQGADFMQLESRGNTYIASAAKSGEPLTQREVDQLDLGDELYVGLFLCAHEPQAAEKAIFRDVHIIQPAQADENHRGA